MTGLSFIWIPNSGLGLSDTLDIGVEDGSRNKLLFGQFSGFSGTNTEDYTGKSAFQNGQTFYAQQASERSISFSFRVSGDSYNDLNLRKAEISQYFAPIMGEGTLRVNFPDGRTYDINAVPFGAPIFNDRAANAKHATNCTIFLTAYNPFWFDPSLNSYNIYVFKGGFVIPGVAFRNLFFWTTNAGWNLNTARRGLAGCGTQSSALSFGGYTGSYSAVTEKFDGSSWTTNAGWNLNTARYGLPGCGTQSSALSFGGYTSSNSAVTEKFDGSTWATNAGWNLNTARSNLAGCGTQSSALGFGGTTGSNSAVTEKFDGSTWTTDAGWNLNTARQLLSGCGTQSSALSFGGYTGSNSAVTEKFDGTAWSTNSAWNLNTARHTLAGCGTQSSALSFGGYTSSYSAVTEKFDGTAWSTNSAWNLNTARHTLAGCGTQSSALSFGGDAGSYSAVTEKFNLNTNPDYSPDVVGVFVMPFSLGPGGRENLTNSGHVPTPVVITVWGPTTNPVITNTRTGEKISVTKTLLEGEKITINTSFDSPAVVYTDLNGDEFSLLSAVSADSEFWSLQPGENIISLIDTTALGSNPVVIEWYNQYWGIL